MEEYPLLSQLLGPNGEDIVLKLHQIPRRRWPGVPSAECETLARHIEKVAFAVKLYAPHKPTINAQRVIDMAAAHDITWALLPDGLAEKITIQQKDAVDPKLISRVQYILGERGLYVQSVFTEYKLQTSAEALLVDQFDKLDPAVQALEYGRQGYPFPQAYERAKTFLQDPTLIKIWKLLGEKTTSKNFYLDYFTLLQNNG